MNIIKDNPYIKGIILPDSLETIGNYAFMNCEYLTSVSIPGGVSIIGGYAFCGTGLTSVSIPEGVTYMGSAIFGGCTSLANIAVDEDNTAYCSDGGVLFDKNKTTLVAYPGGKSGSYSIPGGVSIIEDSAFEGCTGLTGVSLPEGLVTIGYSAFIRCQLTGLTFPSTLTTIRGSAFQGNRLTSITIPSGVTIGLGVFSDNRLTSVTIESGVTSIGDSMFNNNQLTSVTIPDTVMAIGSFAFNGNSALTAITVDGSNTAYMDIDGVLFTKDGKTLHTYPQGKATAYTIPGTVEAIGKAAFNGCRFSSIIIPSGVTSIGENAFSNNQLTSVTIPGTVTAIGNYAFFNNPLTSVSIGANVSVGSSWPGDFHTAYAAQSQAAGTYTREDWSTTTWNYTP
jgi:hypothetical protein